MQIKQILAGRIKPLGDTGKRTAMFKTPLVGPVAVTTLGIAGDQQAEKRFHGGPQMAVHHYPQDHYDEWRRRFPRLAPYLALPGAFGENLAISGMTEATVCVGDIYAVGNVHLQVSEVRQPCFKVDLRFQQEGLARAMQETSRTGWYYRVLQPGTIEAGQHMELAARINPEWPLSRLLHFLYQEPLNLSALEEIACLDGLSPSFQELAQKRLSRNAVENWSRRLTAPPELIKATDTPAPQASLFDHRLDGEGC